MQTIGRYQLVEKLGQGGMGIVYRAFDALLERVVAIKVISSPVELSPETRERFFREAKAAGQLSHKNVITIYDLGEHEGQPYLAMEYLEGEDLQRRLQRPDKMSLFRKIDLAIEICEGLDYAHSHGVVHRDIKPANIFITERGTAKILDFGLARLMTSQLTHTNMLMGTVNYMAPEQVRGERADQRSDVFSIGVVLYELLSGKKAFEGDSFASTLYKILQEVPEPLWNIDATLPRDLVAIVERALAKPKDERYQHMSELREDLSAYRHRMLLETDALTAGIPSGARPSSDSRRVIRDESEELTRPATPTPFPVRPPSGARSGTVPPPEVAAQPAWRPGIVIPVGALIVAAIAVSVWIAQRGTRQQTAPPAAATQQTAPVDPLAEPLRQAREALQARDHAGAQRYADVVLKQDPTNAEARRIHDAARDGLLAAALERARTRFAAGDFAEASRFAGDALAIVPGNAEATRIMEQAGARLRGRGADEARLRMTEARLAAQTAGAPRLVPTSFRNAVRVDQEAQRLYKAGRTAEAMAKFYEASGLYRSAESSARAEAAAAAAAALATPPPPAERPTDTAKPVPPPEPTPSATPPAPLPKPPDTSTTAPAVPPSTTVKPPAPPPADAPTPELSPRSPTADDRVAELLARYKAALESRNLDDLRRLWPSLGGAPQDAIRNEFQHASRISVELVEPHIQVTGSTASVTFVRRYDLVTVEGQRLHSEARTVMEVRRTPAGAWVIESIRFIPLR